MEKQAYLDQIDAVIAAGPYADTWDSLGRYEPPAWYRSAKFGIFIHWGVYSVPAFLDEWYPRKMYMQDNPCYAHHLKTYGPHKQFGYRDFIPMFTASRFDPQAWAELFARAGARYVVPVAEHHDGFAMYDTQLNRFNAVKMGPKRDVLGQLFQAFEARGLVCGASSHRLEHWFFMSHGKDFDSDMPQHPKEDDLYWPSMPDPDYHRCDGEPGPDPHYLADWLARCCELVDRYRPSLVYFDWWIAHNAVKPYLRKFLAYYYNRAAQWGKQVAVNYKHEACPLGTAVPDVERGQFSQAKPYFWQTDTAIAKNSWCYTQGNDYKAPEVILRDLCDIVSKNGTLLLNVGPMPDGAIGPEDTRVLEQIGAWMAVNGEAIYDTRPWRVFGEGPTRVAEGQFTDGTDKTFTPQDIRFTCAGGAVYAAVLLWPQEGSVTVRALAQANFSQPGYSGRVAQVSVLGYDQKPQWTRDEAGLHVRAPFVQSAMPVVLKILVD